MADVRFDETSDIPTPAGANKQGGISGFLISHGIVKTQSGADAVMISCIVVALVGAVIVWRSGESKNIEFTPQDKQHLESTTGPAPRLQDL
jgi:hypothetical protein